MSTVGSLILAVEEVAQWLESFKEALAKGSPTDIVYSLVQMGIDSPTGVCVCDMKWVERDPPETLWPWLHNNHRRHNRSFWELIPKEMFPKLRRVLQNDLCRIYLDDEAFASEPSGNIVSHEYAKQLLDHFLWANEERADWI